MTKFITILVGVLFSLNSLGQLSCDISQLSKQDKLLLREFWTKFKTSINKKDKISLAALVNFPFECDYCTEGVMGDVKITEKQFHSKQYKIFFTSKLQKEFDKDILDIIEPNYGKLQKKCSYRFAYVSIDPSNGFEGQQIFFVVEKVGGQFKITSTWTVA